MPCIPIPKPAPPALPAGIKLVPGAIPSQTFGANVCCKIISYTTPKITSKIPAIALNAAVVAAVRSVFDSIGEAIDKIQPECPRN